MERRQHRIGARQNLQFQSVIAQGGGVHGPGDGYRRAVMGLAVTPYDLPRGCTPGVFPS